ISFNYLGRFAGSDPEHGEVPWLPISEVTLDEAHSGDLAAASVLDINAVTTDTAHGPILRATWSFPRGILSEDEVTELAELWSRALGSLSEYVDEHSERELTPTDLDLVTADQQSIEQLERRFPDLTDIWSLSPLQSGMLFHAQFDETEIDPYMVQLTLELGGRVEAPRLRRAAQALVDRHPSLRAGFASAPGGRALQVIRSGVEIGWAEIDLSGTEDSEVAFAQLLERDRAQRFDMETAPLIRFMLVRFGPDTARFVVTNHHILLDGWSTPLLLRDLLTLYATDGDPEILPRVQSYRDYLTWISKQHPDSSLRAWQEALRGVDSSTQLSQASTAAETVASDIHSYSLPTERAETLRAFARSRGLTMATLVQVAWGIVLAELLGRDDVVF
ncbi:condensation domain-containing protein, partial [Rhodococcus erythropolis]|nr:condensation domain-containing protein [Rhodococcus erythropolis]